MLTRTLPLFALTLCLLLAGGCVKVKQVVTVMPDGSGKLEFTFGVSQALAAQAGEDPLEEFTLENMMDEGGLPEGVVAMTEPTRWEEGGYDYVSFTMYFEDINAVSAPEGDSGEMFANYEFVSEDSGCTLTVRDGMMQQMLADYEKPGADEIAMMGAMLEGMEMVEHYVLPGEAEAIDGVTMVDNTADITITKDNIINGDGPIADLQGAGPLELVVAENSLDQGTIDAFAAEMAQAIEDWEAILEEMEMGE
jgi:hypothetical protein